MAYAGDLKSSGDFTPCGFDSHPGHTTSANNCSDLAVHLFSISDKMQNIHFFADFFSAGLKSTLSGRKPNLDIVCVGKLAVLPVRLKEVFFAFTALLQNEALTF
jgi:hypothetical protein